MYYNTLSPFPGTAVHDWCLEHEVLKIPDKSEDYLISALNENISGVSYERVRYWAPLLYKLIPEENRHVGPPSNLALLKLRWRLLRRMALRGRA